MIHEQATGVQPALRAAADSRSLRFWRMWERYGIFMILAVFGIVLSLLSDRFLTPNNLVNVMKQSATLAVLSLGLLVPVVTGHIDLTIGAFAGLAGALFAGMSLSLGLVPALSIGFAVAVAWGLLVGFLVTRGKALDVIVTLAMLTVAQGLLLLYTSGRPIIGFPVALRLLGNSSVGPIPTPVITALVLAVVIHILLRYTVYGRELYTIGGNEEAARLSGIRVKLRIISAYVIAALMAATAGLVMVGRVSSAQPTAGVGDEFAAVGAVLIGGASLAGGVGTVGGTLAGVIILGMISNGLNLLNVNPYFQYVVKGLIILFAILMDQWGRRYRR